MLIICNQENQSDNRIVAIDRFFPLPDSFLDVCFFPSVFFFYYLFIFATYSCYLF